jgi:putative endonuclease
MGILDFFTSTSWVMAFYVYLIRSIQEGIYYKGSSEDPIRRLQEHNDGLSEYTSFHRPWVLVYVEELPDKREMLIRERKLKRGNKGYFESLIKSEKNIVKSFQ